MSAFGGKAENIGSKRVFPTIPDIEPSRRPASADAICHSLNGSNGSLPLGVLVCKRTVRCTSTARNLSEISGN